MSNEAQSQQEQSKLHRKRLTRKQADKYQPYLFADGPEEVIEQSLNMMHVDSCGYVRLEDILSEATEGEKRQILHQMGVKAVNGSKVRFTNKVQKQTKTKFQNTKSSKSGRHIDLTKIYWSELNAHILSKVLDHCI